MEEREWKPFRNALDKSDRKKFDDMFDTPRLYFSACSNSVQLVPLHPIIIIIIIISILVHHYRELKEYINQVGHMEAKVNSSKKKDLIKKEGEYYLLLNDSQ
jgi:hypothetical protein